MECAGHLAWHGETRNVRHLGHEISQEKAIWEIKN